VTRGEFLPWLSPAILKNYEMNGDMMQIILLRKDILARITATLFLISGVVIAWHFGTFM
jgi:hypothetical protein